MIKKILIVVGGLILFFFGFLVWFNATFSMEEAKAFETNNSDAQFKVLIATQGSEYKDKLVEELIALNDEVYFNVIDVTSLSDVMYTKWDAIILMHTWEIWEPEEHSAEFLEEHADAENIFVVSTSGGGDLMIPGVDGISGASSLTDVSKDAGKITSWIHQQLWK
jgi:hypothetical protein